MIDAAIILLGQFEDFSKHKLAKYIEGNLKLVVVTDVIYRQPLEEIFSNVIVYDYIKRTLEIGVKGINDELLKLVKEERPKYVVWLRNMYEFQEETFDAIRKEGVIIIGLFSDDEYRFAYHSKWWVAHLDYIITFDFQALPRYKALGAGAIHVLPCEGTPLDIDWSKAEENYEVSFVGGKAKSGRTYYINEILKNDLPISLFGQGWEGGYVSTEKMIDIFRTSKINLNFSGTGRRTGLKGRPTFIMLAGGFLLTEYTPGLENFFEFDKEIVVFKTAEEMIEKIKYYLVHDDERRAIALAGWERAKKEYTPVHMFERVFNTIREDLDKRGAKSQSQALKMPLWIRRAPSIYYFQWGRAFLEEGYDNLWKDAISLSLAYNPCNIVARYYYIGGMCPMWLRWMMFKLYAPMDTLGKWINRTSFSLYDWAESVPGLRYIKRRVSRSLSYS